MRKMILLALTLTMLSAASANAQVRIGGIENPHPAAVLDLNASDAEEPVSNPGGFYLPRVKLTSVTDQLNGADPLNGAVVWNTNDDFYLGKGIYFWGDTVWVPIKRTLFDNSTLQPITTDPIVTVLSNPALGLGVTFQVPAAYADMSNTFRFLWNVTANGEPSYTPKDSASGSRREVLFVPYDDTERTYKVQAQAIPNNGSSDLWFSEWVESNPGRYQGQYRITGATGYDICKSNTEDPLYGRNRDQLVPDKDYPYTVETLGGTGEANYQWSIDKEKSPEYVSLSDEGKSATVKFNASVLSKDFSSNIADTIFLQCSVNDGREIYTLLRKITVGDRDECSPKAGLLDAEGNRYTVSKFGGVCWMTQNLRSTYTWQGNQKQEIKEDVNPKNDNNAVSYYYPGGVTMIKDNPAEYGLLYTWGAANIGTATTEATNAFPNKSSDRQGICPEGWVIPSDYDLNQLEEEIATHPELYSSQTEPHEWQSRYEIIVNWRPGTGSPTADWWGRSMKSSTSVNSIDPQGLSYTDGTGFNALLVGFLGTGAASDYGTYSYCWSSSADSATAAWRRYLINNASGVNRSPISKYHSFPVRCKKI